MRRAAGPAARSRLPSRHGRSRSACIANGRLRHTGEGAFLGGGSLPHQAPWKVTDSLRTPGASTVSPFSACLFTIGEEWALRWPSPVAPLVKRRLAGGGRTVSSAGRRGADSLRHLRADRTVAPRLRGSAARVRVAAGARQPVASAALCAGHRPTVTFCPFSLTSTKTRHPGYGRPRISPDSRAPPEP